jgi:hypothetical protein
MAPHPTDQDWRCIAEEVSIEMDPAKLITLVARLCDALDRKTRKHDSIPATTGG